MPMVTSVQFLRFVAALAVVIYHANIFTNIIIPRQGDALTMQIGEIGAIGVPIFFVISGFIMLHTSTRVFATEGAVRRFLLRRFLRVYPIYWLTFVLYLIFWFEFPSTELTFSVQEVLGSLVLWPGYSGIVIGPAWTLTFEFYFYLIFGFTLFFRIYTGMILLAVYISVSVLFGLVCGAESGSPFLEVVTRPVLLEFLAGVCIGIVLLDRRLSDRIVRPWTVRLSLFAALTGIAAIPMLQDMELPPLIVLGVPSVLLVASLVFAEELGMAPPLISRLSWLGDSSYSLYLIHLLVMSKLVPVARFLFEEWDFHVVSLIIFYSAASFVAGLALYFLAEKPLLKVLRKYTPGKPILR